MAEFPNFTPRYVETEDSIRARLDTDVVAGTDIRIGSHYYNATEPSVKEFARFWDILNDAMAASTYLFANDIYLDYHAQNAGLVRNSASKATGEVTFTGTDGTNIPSGTSITTEVEDDSQTPIRFITIDSGTISGTTATVSVEAEAAGANGNVMANTITNIEDGNSGLSAVTNTNSFSGGADIEDDESLRERISIEVASPQGAGNVADYIRWGLAKSGIGSITVVPLWDGPNTVKVIALDPDNNQLSQTALDELQELYTGAPVLADPTTAPSAAIGSAGALTGTFYYEVTFQDTSGETKPGTISAPVTVSSQQVNLTSIPVGPTGTVSRSIYRRSGTTGKFYLVTTITDNTTTTYVDNTASVSSNRVAPKVNNTTNYSDALVPVGAVVTVDTPTVISITIASTISFNPGYSLDGTGGTISRRSELVAAETAYVNSLAPGVDVVIKHVDAQYFTVPGVYDVSGTTINTVASNFVIAPDEVSDLSSVVLT